MKIMHIKKISYKLVETYDSIFYNHHRLKYVKYRPVFNILNENSQADTLLDLKKQALNSFNFLLINLP